MGMLLKARCLLHELAAHTQAAQSPVLHDRAAPRGAWGLPQRRPLDINKKQK